MPECVVVSVYLDDYTVFAVGRCTLVALGVCFVDVLAVQLFFLVARGIWATPWGGPMSVNTDGEGSLVGPRSRSATVGSPCVYT